MKKLCQALWAYVDNALLLRIRGEERFAHRGGRLSSLLVSGGSGHVRCSCWLQLALAVAGSLYAAIKRMRNEGEGAGEVCCLPHASCFVPHSA